MCSPTCMCAHMCVLCAPKLVCALGWALVFAPKLGWALLCALKLICMLICAPKLLCVLVCAPKLVYKKIKILHHGLHPLWLGYRRLGNRQAFSHHRRVNWPWAFSPLVITISPQLRLPLAHTSTHTSLGAHKSAHTSLVAQTSAHACVETDTRALMSFEHIQLHPYNSPNYVVKGVVVIIGKLWLALSTNIGSIGLSRTWPLRYFCNALDLKYNIGEEKH